MRQEQSRRRKYHWGRAIRSTTCGLLRRLLAMDNYPAHLAPEFDEGGGVMTPFEEWWARAVRHFRNVPEQVARDWLHRHWNYSPFGWLPSADYQFRLVDWPADRISDIRTGWNDFKFDPFPAIAQGEFLAVEHRRRWESRLVDFMVTTGTFPVPPVVIDNLDDHLRNLSGVPFPYPPAFLLVEGHRRFNIAAYLERQGRLQPNVPFWLMEHSSR